MHCHSISANDHALINGVKKTFKYKNYQTFLLKKISKIVKYNVKLKITFL